jgi:hypothetical protein
MTAKSALLMKTALLIAHAAKARLHFLRTRL